jgi:hypothetical protein
LIVGACGELPITRLPAHGAFPLTDTLELYFYSLDYGLDRVQEIRLPNAHLLRVRHVYCDDKRSCIFYWNLEYLLPENEAIAMSLEQLGRDLRHERDDDASTWHSFEIQFRKYDKGSDGFDPDHSSYYPLDAASDDHQRS